MTDLDNRDIATWFAAAPAFWREAHGPETQGRVTRAGFDVAAYCHPGYCRQDGPFRTRAAVETWSRTLGAALRSGNTPIENALLDEAARLRDAP